MSSLSVRGCRLKGSVCELRRCRRIMARSITAPLGRITGSAIKVSIKGSTTSNAALLFILKKKSSASFLFIYFFIERYNMVRMTITSISYCGIYHIYFYIVFCIWMTSSGIQKNTHICTLKQNSMSTCRQNKHTQRHIVEAENAISNWENYTKFVKELEPMAWCYFFHQMRYTDVCLPPGGKK